MNFKIGTIIRHKNDVDCLRISVLDEDIFNQILTSSSYGAKYKFNLGYANTWYIVYTDIFS